MVTKGSEKVIEWLGTGSVNIFGRPFSGKDTQAHNLATAVHGAVIAGGDILRSYHDQAKIKALMATGKLFPTDFYFSVVLPYLTQPKLINKPLILSTVGRWHGEEEMVLQATRQAGHPIKAVVLLDVPETEVRRRFEATERKQVRGERHDDDARILEVRLEEFRTKTRPVIDFYRAKGLLVTVDGTATPAEVTRQILKQLEARI